MPDNVIPMRQPTVAEAEEQYRGAVRDTLDALDQTDPLSDDELAYIVHCFEHAIRTDTVARTIGAIRSVQNIVMLRKRP